MAKRANIKTGCKRTTSGSNRGRTATPAAGKAKRPTGKAGKTAGGAKKVARRATPTTKRRTAGASRLAGAKADAKNRAAEKTADRKPATKAANAGRTSRTAAPLPGTSQDPVRFAGEQRRLPKTHLSAKELREFKELLLRKRGELTGDVERLTDEALTRRGRGPGEQSSMPIHMADLGSDNWEQEFTLGLIANERALVREIDEALYRIANRTYGTCLATHKKISKARLRARPWARYCIEHARAREEGRAP